MSRLTLTAAQENLIRNVLERNHSYYVDQGMSRSHMWPEELLSEIRNELEHVSRDAPEPGSPEEKVAEQMARTTADVAIALGRAFNSKVKGK